MYNEVDPNKDSRPASLTAPTGYLAAAIEALRYRAATEAGMSQAPELFSADETQDWAVADYLQQHLGSRLFTEHADVQAFQEKFSIPMSPEPAFLDPHAIEFRMKFMQEELTEFAEACSAGNLPDAADALVDLAYVLHGTALMMGLPWDQLWNEVQRANMAKVRAAKASDSKRGSALDVVKPEGWMPPDHRDALEMAIRKPRMFCTTCRSLGFEPSAIGEGCSFCDGSEGGL